MMKKLSKISALGIALLAATAFADQEHEGKQPKYFHAEHGYNGGEYEAVDIQKLEGFEAIKTLDDLAKFAAKVPGAIGFTAHPDFEKGMRLASVMMSYTRRSPKSESWALYLFDEKDAKLDFHND